MLAFCVYNTAQFIGALCAICSILVIRPSIGQYTKADSDKKFLMVEQMKKLLSASLMVLGVAGASSLASAAGDAAKGESLAATCTACHGADGNSPTPMFPKIAGLGEKYIAKQLVDIQTKVRDIPEMTGLLDNMSAQDLNDLAAFFSSKTLQLSGAKEFTVQLNSGAEVDALKLGEQVYRAGNQETGVAACSGCHSPTGKGNAPAGFPKLGGQYADYVEKQLRAFRAGDRANDGEAMIMRLVAKNMSDAEIKAVANYISGLN